MMMFQIADSRERGDILHIEPLDGGGVSFSTGQHQIDMRARDLPGFIEFLSNIEVIGLPEPRTHFRFQRLPANAEIEAIDFTAGPPYPEACRSRVEPTRCPDCTSDPGWYVGFTARRPCPTCCGGE